MQPLNGRAPGRKRWVRVGQQPHVLQRAAKTEKGRLMSTATQAYPEGAGSYSSQPGSLCAVLHHMISGVPFTDYRCISTSQKVHLDFLALQ